MNEERGHARGPSRRTALKAGMTPRRQTGQVLLWFLGTVAACAAVLYGVYNVGQVTAAKQKAVNAADAAAYAGAMTQARALNFMAYTNRAAIANEVFICQLISLNSWLQYAAKTGENIGTVLSYIPYLNAIGYAMTEAAEYVEEANVNYLGEAIDTAVQTIEVMKSFHLGPVGSNTLIYGAAGLMARNAATHTVAANKTTFGSRTDSAPTTQTAMDIATFAANETQWLDFSERYVDDKRAVAKEVLLASRDAFSTHRPGNMFMNITVNIPVTPLGLEKLGGTQLVDYDRWEAQDTVEFWFKYWGTCGGLFRVPCVKKQYVPIGWGRSTLASQATEGDEWDPHRYAQQLAVSDGLTHSHWSGVPTLRDITDRSQAARENLGLDFWVVVRKAGAHTLTTSTLGIAKTPVASNLGSADMNERQLGDQVNAIGKARVYFERPVRNAADFTAASLLRKDDAKEFGSLYSPFWQVRLAPVGNAEKALVNAALGGPVSSTLVTQ